MHDITYGAGLYAMATWNSNSVKHTIHTSPDLVTWSDRQAAASGPVDRIVYGGGRFVAYGHEFALTSTTGINWTEYTITGLYSPYLFTTFAKDRFYVRNMDGLYVSTNGTYLNPLNLPIDTGVTGVAYGNGRYVSVGAQGLVLTSTNGLYWDPAYVDTTPPGDADNIPRQLLAVTYVTNTFVAVGPQRLMFVSRNGVNWAKADSKVDDALVCLASANGLLVGLSAKGLFAPLSIPPPVRIVLPTNGAPVVPNVAITLEADAQPGDAPVRQVTFLVDEIPVGTVTNAPYRLAWTPKANRIYRVAATATDLRANTSESTAIGLGDWMAPAIVRQPTSQTVAVGDTAVFSVGAEGTDPLYYYWTNNSALRASTSFTTTEPTFVLTNVTLNHAGYYQVAVSNSIGSRWSQVVSLTVATRPVITEQPLSTMANLGGSAGFRVDAFGAAPLTFQWFKNGAVLSGATNGSLNLNNIQSTNLGSYSVRVSNASGTTNSNPATLSLCSYTLSPASTTIASAGGSGSFSVATSGGCDWTATPGQSWLHTTSTGSGNGTASYTVDANLGGAARSGTVTVGTATFAISQAGVSAQTISVSAAPANGGRATGGGAFVAGTSVTVLASATNGYVFQSWTESGAVVSTNPAYSFTVVGPRSLVANFALPAAFFVGADATSQGNWPGVYGQGGYLIPGVVTNLPTGWLGSVAGAAYFATLHTADAPEALALGPSLVPLPRSRGCWYSTGTTFTVNFNVPTGATNRLAFYCAGPGGRAQKVEMLEPTSGAVLDTRNLSNFAGGTYLSWNVRGPVRARITSTAAGQNAVLQGIFVGAASGAAPSFRAQPASSTVANAGSRVALAASVSGAPPLRFQWVKDNQAVAGATGPVLGIPSAAAASAGRYWLLASNTLGYAMSQAAELVVVVPDPTKGRLLAADHATRGNWKGTYGSGTNGILLVGQATNLVVGTAVGWSGGSYFTLNASTPSPFALERVGNTLPTDRFLGCYFSPTNFTVSVSLPSGVTNTLALYLVLAEGRSERVDLINPANGSLLNSQTVTGSSNGVYLVWAVNGNVQAKVTRLAGANAMISAVFIGNGTGAPVVRTQPPADMVVSGRGAAAFGVSASGLPALYYQWRKNGVPVADGAHLRGATAPVLQLSQVGVAEAGDYTLVVTNVYGRATSTVCRVTVDRVASLQDLNSDGIDDLVFQNSAGALTSWLMDGQGQAVSGRTIYDGNLGDWELVALADVNSDGKTDLILQNTPGEIVAWLMNGQGQATTGITIFSGNLGDWRIIAAADLNSDGQADLVFQNAAGQVEGWLMDGHGQATTGITIYSSSIFGWKVATMGDVNGDGIADLIWQTPLGSVVAWLVDGQGHPTVGVTLYGGTLAGWRIAGMKDVDGDGIGDLVWQSTSGSVLAWLMDGNNHPTVALSIYSGSLYDWLVH